MPPFPAPVFPEKMLQKDFVSLRLTTLEPMPGVSEFSETRTPRIEPSGSSPTSTLISPPKPLGSEDSAQYAIVLPDASSAAKKTTSVPSSETAFPASRTAPVSDGRSSSIFSLRCLVAASSRADWVFVETYASAAPAIAQMRVRLKVSFRISFMISLPPSLCGHLDSLLLRHAEGASCRHLVDERSEGIHDED